MRGVEAPLPLFDAMVDHLAASDIPASDKERRVYDLIARHKGHKNPISINHIHRITGISERGIKDAVAELVGSHRVMIGAMRGRDNFGYFLIESAEDQEIALAPYRNQVLAMLRRMRVLQGAHKVREWMGQEVAEL
ncbi:MAG TPA: hypothetical protein VG273_11925 [Bryobacteraceae bacterium]|jgi:hypothetical protein|nr:hypothetical protein [Bryobacteraceae bacterium]